MKPVKTCAALTIPLIAAAVVTLFFLGLAIRNVATTLQAEFGLPAASLGALQRINLSLKLWRARADLTAPVNPYGEPQPFHIELGETPAAVSLRLQEDGLIRDAAAFQVYLIYSGLDTRLQAGDYTLSPADDARQIARQLLDPTPGDAQLVILAGWRLEEVAAALPTSGLALLPEEFIAAAQVQGAEGYLFPGSYAFPRGISAPDLLTELRAVFDQAVSDEMRAAYQHQGLTLHQAVTLASIVEREAVVEDEMPLIASVFLNRLNAGIKLDADPTVQYALGYNAAQGTWWTNPLSAADLQIDSPYNTYRYPGLPPGPIANPGLNALRAVAFPAQTPYYYFRAACDGSGRHLFAESFAEHVNNACP